MVFNIAAVCVRANEHVCRPNYEKFTRTHSEHAAYICENWRNFIRNLKCTHTDNYLFFVCVRGGTMSERTTVFRHWKPFSSDTRNTFGRMEMIINESIAISRWCPLIYFWVTTRFSVGVRCLWYIIQWSRLGSISIFSVALIQSLSVQAQPTGHTHTHTHSWLSAYNWHPLCIDRKMSRGDLGSFFLEFV